MKLFIFPIFLACLVCVFFVIIVTANTYWVEHRCDRYSQATSINTISIGDKCFINHAGVMVEIKV